MKKIMITVALVALTAGVGTGCKKKTQVKDSGDMSAEVKAPETREDPAVGTGLPDPGEVETLTLERIHFEFDQAGLTAQAKEILARNAQILRENPTVKIRLEGHCDSRGSTEYNLALGERRAEAVAKYLQNLGVKAGNLITVSLGEEKPVNPAETESAWAENRRAEHVVIEGSDRVVGSVE
jgi:peptidoglycan-associated lipoprotein